MAPSGECYYNTLLRSNYFSSSSVVSRAFSALCVYSKFGHHLHTVGYLCNKFCFFCGLHCEASPWRISLPKVIWEEGRVAALSQTDAIKSLLVTTARPKIAPKSTPSCGPIPKLHYLPHPWTCPTYDAKRHPDPIRRFSTMHWTDRRTDRQTHQTTHRRTDRQIVHGMG